MLITEKVGGSACRQDEVIVFGFPNGSLYHVLFRENGAYFRHSEIKVFPVLENFTERNEMEVGSIPAEAT